MDARDFRSIGRAAQEELRRRALLLTLQQGLSQAQAAEVVGVQRQTVNIWLQRYRAQGEDGVLDGRRVSPRRGKGLLAAEEATKVQGWIRDRTPDQLKLPFALWTSRAVRDLITARFGKTLGLSTVQLYLQRWNMTPQKPLARARERQPAAIAAWLEQHYPAIARRAKAEGAAIYWGDETGIDPPSNQWTPLLSSTRGRKVLDDENTTDVHGRVQARGGGLAREQRPAAAAGGGRTRDPALDAAQLARHGLRHRSPHADWRDGIRLGDPTPAVAGRAGCRDRTPQARARPCPAGT